MAMAEPRSWLFVPADSERKLAKALDSGADAIILDLEDSVAIENKPAARALAGDFLASNPRELRRTAIWVRVNEIGSDWCATDVSAVVNGAPDGLMLPKAEGPGDCARLSDLIGAAGGDDAIAILPVASETPRAVFRLGQFAEQVTPRLTGITWGAEDLAAAINAVGNRHADGGFHDSFRVVRALALFAAHAAGVQAIDTLHADFRDEAGLKASSEAARREGFSGRLAIHPAQVPIINAAFMATDAEVAFAEKVVAAFSGAGAVGAIGIDGKMIDRPHLIQAEKLLARHRTQLA